MPFDERISPVSINPLEQVQRTKTVQDESRRKKRENPYQERRQRDSIELSDDIQNAETASAQSTVEKFQTDEAETQEVSHIDVIIH